MSPPPVLDFECTGEGGSFKRGAREDQWRGGVSAGSPAGTVGSFKSQKIKSVLICFANDFWFSRSCLVDLRVFEGFQGAPPCKGKTTLHGATLF